MRVYGGKQQIKPIVTSIRAGADTFLRKHVFGVNDTMMNYLFYDRNLDRNLQTSLTWERNGVRFVVFVADFGLTFADLNIY